jgi:catechol 2,3-dioxygenase-like lactoylglutathione lyase family enzyme
MLLGFAPLLELDVNVSDPAEAAGLNMPPYQLHAAPMALSDGYVIDLIRWQDPYDPSAPYAAQNHLGVTTLSLTTTNLTADMAALSAHGVVFAGPDIVDRPVASSQRITLSDPDGVLIEIVQPGNVPTGGTPNGSGQTYISGALQTNINVSDYEQSRAFYEMLGFALEDEYEQGSPGTTPHVRRASMSLPQGHNLNLSKWEDPSDPAPPYDALNHLGIARIAIQTANIDADIQLLEDNGIAFYTDPITPSGPLGILRYACFEDPDGTVIELVQYNN